MRLARLALGTAIAAACGSSGGETAGGGSRCVAFAPASAPALRLVSAGVAPPVVMRLASGAGHDYALDNAGKIHVLGATDAVALDAGSGAQAFAVASDARVFV